MAYKYPETKKKPLFFRFLRFFITHFYKRREFVGMENLPDEPFVAVGNHCLLHSPLTCELYFPTKKNIWCTHEMMSAKEIPDYGDKTFWPGKSKGVAKMYRFFAWIISPVVAYVFKHSDTIPVYRDKRIVSTMEQSVEGLKKGENAVIFGESDELHNNIVNDFNRGFVDVARLYYAKTKKCLTFVPMYNAVALKKVCFGTPIVYDPKAKPADERERIVAHVKDEITRVALELPAHRVVPFAPPADGQNPMSK